MDFRLWVFDRLNLDHFDQLVTTSDLLFGKFLLLRKGKRSYAVLKLV